MSDQITVTITNNTGGNAEIVLFYSETGSQTCSGSCTLGDGDTSGTILTVPVPWTLEYWAISVLVKDGPNAGYYVNQPGSDGSNWYECALDAGSYTFAVDTTTLTLDGYQVGMQLAAPRPDISAPAISHVFVVMLENRSFDHMLAFSGIPGIVAATTADSNTWMIMDGAKRAEAAAGGGVGIAAPETCHVRAGNPTTMPTDPGHEFPDVVMQLCGEFSAYQAPGYPAIDNSGFLASYATSTTEAPYQPPQTDAELDMIMTCFDQGNLRVLTKLAANFAVCDNWFASMPGPTWPNRFFLHAASSAAFDHSPSNEDMAYWESVEGLTFPNGTVFDRLSAKGIAFQLYQDYTDDWLSYYSADPDAGGRSGAVPQAGALSGLSLVSSFSPLSGLKDDLSGPYPYPYTFIEPHYGDTYDGTYKGGSSQHPMDEVYGGENLLAGVYDAIRSSPYWPTSLLVICYDEHGGFYDSVKPPAGTNPGDLKPGDAQWNQDNQYGFDFTQLGVRVPAVLVSPLIPSGTVGSKDAGPGTVFDHSSVSKLLSQLWGTATMTERDAGAASPLSLLSLATPRTDHVTLPAPAPPTGAATTLSAAEKAARLAEPLPESGNEIGTLIVLRKADLEMSDGSQASRAAILERVNAIRTRGDADAYARDVLERIGVRRAAQPKAGRRPIEPEPLRRAN